MKKILFTLLSIWAFSMLMDAAFAGFKVPPKKGAQPAPAKKGVIPAPAPAPAKAATPPPPPANNQQQAPACQHEGAIGNMLFCDDHHTVYSRAVCHGGNWVYEDQNGGRANCPGPPVVLNDCGSPQGGWINGTTYVLNQDVQKTSPVGVGGSACINIHGTENVTLDCQGHSIIGPRFAEMLNGVEIRNNRHVEIKNCNIVRFENGLLSMANTNDSRLTHNTFDDNNFGIRLQGGGDEREELIFTANSACNNRRSDIECGVERIRGSGNHFHNAGICRPLDAFSDCQ